MTLYANGVVLYSEYVYHWNTCSWPLLSHCGVVDDVGQHNLVVENIYIPKKWCWVEYVHVVSNDTSDFVKKENIKNIKALYYWLFVSGGGFPFEKPLTQQNIS